MDWNKYPNFSEKEFSCHSSGKCYMSEEFIDKLQAIRTEFGKPMKITSGYRDISHPEEKIKPKGGEHTLGLACDVRVSGGDALELLAIALKHGIKRVGISQRGTVGSRFIHLGMASKEDGFTSPAIWSY